jgi:hypothetical protein
MSIATDNYLLALKSLSQAKEVAEETAEPFILAARKLGNLKTAYVSLNGDIERGNPETCISQNGFPSLEDLKNALGRYQAAGSNLHSAWSSLSKEDQQSGVFNPPVMFF